jgi:two-component system LytT family response regulator
MSKLRILIVDDEPLARSRVRAFLRSEPSAEIVGECADGAAALEAIRRERPDVVFLDLQMPGVDGRQVLASLPATPRPAIVILTAHDRFAVEAFAAQVTDYLLKPFDQARFALALQRAAEQLRNSKEKELGTRLEGLLAAAPGRPPPRLVFKADGRVVFLAPSEIIWVEAANNYVTLHLAAGKRLLVRETLSSLERKLGPASFARVNRSALVNIDHVQELQPAKYGDYRVVLRDGPHLSLSRSLRGRLERFGLEAR